jgi:hypothetical protein
MKKKIYGVVILLAGSVGMALQGVFAEHVHVVNASTKTPISVLYRSDCFGGRYGGSPTEIAPGQQINRSHATCTFANIEIKNAAGHTLFSRVGSVRGIAAIVVDDPRKETGLRVIADDV